MEDIDWMNECLFETRQDINKLKEFANNGHLYAMEILCGHYFHKKNTYKQGFWLITRALMGDCDVISWMYTIKDKRMTTFLSTMDEPMTEDRLTPLIEAIADDHKRNQRKFKRIQRLERELYWTLKT